MVRRVVGEGIGALFLLGLGIVITSVDYRERAEFGDREAGELLGAGERRMEMAAKREAIGVEDKAERAAEDDLGGAILFDDRGEAEGDAGRDVVEGGFVGDVLNETVVIEAANCAGRGEIFPFGGFRGWGSLRSVGVGEVAWFEVGAVFGEAVVFDDAATDASRKGKIDGFARFVLGLGEGGEIGVVFEIDGLV